MAIWCVSTNTDTLLTQKIKALTRSLDDHTPARLGDAAPVQRNLDPTMHPFAKPREYTRALNAAKLDRLFAKPFVAAFEGHIDGVYSLARDPKRLDRVASGSGDGEIKLWDVNHQHCVYTYPRAHAGIIQSLVISPLTFSGGSSSKRMLSCSTDRTIKVWNADPMPENVGHFTEYAEESEEDEDDEASGARDAHLFSLQPQKLPASEPLTVYNGRTAFNSLSHHAHQPRFASASSTVQVWDMNRGGGSDALLSMSMGIDAANVVRFNPSETEVLASASTDRGITLYDLRSGKPLHKVVLSLRANDIAWSPMEPTTFAVANEDYNMYTFEYVYLCAFLTQYAQSVVGHPDLQGTRRRGNVGGVGAHGPGPRDRVVRSYGASMGRGPRCTLARCLPHEADAKGIFGDVHS